MYWHTLHSYKFPCLALVATDCQEDEASISSLPSNTKHWIFHHFNMKILSPVVRSVAIYGTFADPLLIAMTSNLLQQPSPHRVTVRTFFATAFAREFLRTFSFEQGRYSRMIVADQSS